MTENRFAVFPDAIVLHCRHSSLICDRQGRIVAGKHGLYMHGTRFLSGLELRVDGKEASFVSANAVDARSMIAYYLAPSPAGAKAGPPGDAEEDGGEIARRAIEIQMNRFLGDGLRQELHVTNHGLADAAIQLRLAFRADFADRAEVVKGKRQQNAAVRASWSSEDEAAVLALDYLHPRLDRGLVARIGGDGRRTLGQGAGIDIDLDLAARQSGSVIVELRPRFGTEIRAAADAGFFAVPRPVGGDDGWTGFATSAAPVQAAWARAAGDLAALALGDGDGAERRVPAAGVPPYQALFGRDVLIAGTQAALLSPDLLRGSLRVMARWQGTRDDPDRDEEPGKLLHQRQLSPLAILGENPFRAYYGDYTAPGIFLIAAATDLALAGDRDFARGMLPHIDAALAWMDRYGDADGDGFYEYDTRAKGGLKNQGWKDSNQALLYPDGHIVANPIATAEIQACYYAAKQAAGLLFSMLEERERGRSLLREAAALKRRFNDVFWLPDRRYFAVALDSQKQPVRTIGPDAGQCLAYGIVDDAKAPDVAERLMAADLYSGWGMRTLSADHPAYNPFGYHLGDVWPWATALIAFGLRRHGFEREFEQVAHGLFDASRLFALDRLPEAIGGHPRDAAHPHPGIYPDSASPQAWSASAVIFLVETMLGIVRLAPLNLLLLDPALPEWLPDVRLTGLRFGPHCIDLRFHRDASGWTEHEILGAPQGLTVHRPDAARRRGVDALSAQLRDACGDLL